MKERLPQLARCVDRFTMYYIASSFSQNSPAVAVLAANGPKM